MGCSLARADCKWRSVRVGAGAAGKRGVSWGSLHGLGQGVAVVAVGVRREQGLYRRVSRAPKFCRGDGSGDCGAGQGGGAAGLAGRG